MLHLVVKFEADTYDNIFTFLDKAIRSQAKPSQAKPAGRIINEMNAAAAAAAAAFYSCFSFSIHAFS